MIDPSHNCHTSERNQTKGLTYATCTNPEVDVSVSQRASLLREAESLVDGERNIQYGSPSQDFERTAALWTAYLDGKRYLEAHDVAVMMILLKASRLRWSPTKRDSWVDVAGYAACGWDTVEEPLLDDTKDEE